MSVTGDPDGEPTKAGVAVLDLIAGLELAVGALAALVGRRSTQVRSVEVGLVEAGVTSLVNVLANHLASGEEPRRQGNAHPNIVPYESFRTSDGHLAIAVGNDAQFAALLGVLGLSDTDGRYTTNPARVTHRAALVPWLAEAIGRRGRDELAEALVANGVPAGPLLSVSGALEEMETAHGGAWLQETRGIRLAPSPLRLDGRRASVRRPPPTPGEHTSEILTELGLSAEAIDRLRADAVVH
jgi:crotonobetainyl-CoA:carnitine CoA-transferase CaiB-like acyl-CoA transferase